MMERILKILCALTLLVVGALGAWWLWGESRDSFAEAASTHTQALGAGEWAVVFDIYTRTFDGYGVIFAIQTVTFLIIAVFGAWLLVDILRENR